MLYYMGCDKCFYADCSSFLVIFHTWISIISKGIITEINLRKLKLLLLSLSGLCFFIGISFFYLNFD